MKSRSVSATGDINRSVVVTGDGNSVSLSFGGRFTLPLDRRQISSPKNRRRSTDYNPLPILAPDADVLPLVGRKDVLTDLRGWVVSDADISVHAVIAPAGTGKTRLAIELCRSLDAEAKPGSAGWIAGFIRPGDLASVVNRLATESFDWPAATLLVIDYAAAAHRDLAPWLDRLASEAFVGKLRLLLLDREAPEGFGWWFDLTHPSENRSTTRRDLFLDLERPQSLFDLDQAPERRALFEAALEAATEMMADGAARHSAPPAGSCADFDIALNSPRFGNPLNLAMAGMIAAEHGPIEAIALRRLDAARHLARHELGRMARISDGEGIPAPLARHALGFNGLAGGLPLATLRQDLALELQAAGLPGAAPTLADVLMQELPTPGGEADNVSEPRLGTLQPDLIGEGVIVEALLVGAPDRVLQAGPVIERAYQRTGARAANALMRLIQDYGHALEDPDASKVERETAQAVLGLLSTLIAAIPDEEVDNLETLVLAFPESTTVLREAAAAQTQRLADIWRKRASLVSDDPEAALMAQARAGLWCNNLGVRLIELGDREGALDAAEEAVERHRVLARDAPEVFTPSLAVSLSNLSNRHGDVGRYESALALAQEAVAVRRILAADQPEIYTAPLAGSLNNLAICLSDLNRDEAALAAAEEAAQYYRSLAAADPDAFTARLAVSLNNLSNRLGAAGRFEEGLAAARESVVLRRTLAAAHPDAFLPELAGSLNTLSNRLHQCDQIEAALSTAREAANFYRSLSTARPEAFTHHYAGSINNVASLLIALEQYEEAVEAARETVKLYREIAQVRRVFAADLARALSLLGDALEKAGQITEALAADHESITILSPVFLAQPESFARKMALFMGDYFRRAELAGEQPDMELIIPILSVLIPQLEDKDDDNRRSDS